MREVRSYAFALIETAPGMKDIRVETVERVTVIPIGGLTGNSHLSYPVYPNASNKSTHPVYPLHPARADGSKSEAEVVAQFFGERIA